MESKELLFKDLRKQIYSWFPIKILQMTITCLSQLDRLLAIEIYEARFLDFYQISMSSSLWRCTPNAKENGSLVPYIETILPRSPSFEESRMLIVSFFYLTNFKDFIEYILHFFINYISHGEDNPFKSYATQEALHDIVENVIVEKLERKSICKFLKNTKHSLEVRRSVARTCRSIDTYVIEGIFYVFTHFPKIPALNTQLTALLLTDKYLTQWISGSTLIRLEVSNREMGLIAYLIHFALGEVKGELNKEQVEALLYRLSDNDFCRYLRNYPIFIDPAPVYLRYELLLKVLEKKHPLANNFSTDTILHLINYKKADSKLLLFLVEYFGTKKMTSVLLNAHLMLFIKIVENPFNEAFLTQLLREVTVHELCGRFERSLLFCDFECLLSSKSFLNLLDQLDIIFPKNDDTKVVDRVEQKSVSRLNPLKITCGSSALLMELSKVGYYFGIIILRNDKVARFLTDSDRRLLENFCVNEKNETISPPIVQTIASKSLQEDSKNLLGPCNASPLNESKHSKNTYNVQPLNIEWGKWIARALFVFAGLGFLIGVLAFFDVLFAMEACDVIVNGFVSCASEIATFLVLTASVLLGAITLSLSQIGRIGRMDDKYCAEDTDQKSWNANSSRTDHKTMDSVSNELFLSAKNDQLFHKNQSSCSKALTFSL